MLSIIQELKALGVEISPQGNNLVIHPASKVPAELKERLREQKAEVLAVLKACPATSPKPPKAITCRYDWITGYRGLRLHCVGHRHEPGTPTVFRFVSCGRDVLLEMAQKGILTGQALRDAGRVN